MRILVADDEKNIQSSIKWILEKEGHTVTTCDNGEQAVEHAAAEAFDFVFCDVMMPGIGGIKALESMLNTRPDLKVLMISGHADISTAVNATKMGAYDFMEKPLNPEKVLLEVRKLVDRQRVTEDLNSLKSYVSLDYQMIGSSLKMNELRETIKRAAPSDGRILIYGENGTGKELVAREIHNHSNRTGRFVQLNCAALPKELIESELFGYEKGAFTGAHKRKIGLIEEAEGGTLMLDEVGDMALETQAKLLRVLQENEFTRVGSTKPQKFDVRIVSATNKDLLKEIDAGNFRQDLYFRLNVIPITIPPLRERVGDISELVEHYFNLYALKNGKRPKVVDADAMQLLANYQWPGNIRELRNSVERLSIMTPGETISIADVQAILPHQEVKTAEMYQQIEPDKSLKDQLAQFEKSVLQAAFQKHEGNVSKVAEFLQTDRANLHKKLKKYGIK